MINGEGNENKNYGRLRPEVMITSKYSFLKNGLFFFKNKKGCVYSNLLILFKNFGFFPQKKEEQTIKYLIF